MFEACQLHLVESGLRILWSAYQDYTEDFSSLTECARKRFEKREWEEMRKDTMARLDLYPQWVIKTKTALEKKLGSHRYNRSTWLALKDRYAKKCGHRCDSELAMTFYNSVNRKIFKTVGIKPQIEFVAPDVSAWENTPPQTQQLLSITVDSVDKTVAGNILKGYAFKPAFRDLDGDAQLCVDRIRQMHTTRQDPAGEPVHIRMIRQPFFRDMGAYLIGSIRRGKSEHPLVFVLTHNDHGLSVDALLLRREQLRILFSFSRDYFHVNTPCPGRIVCFLKQLMPQKRIAELYIALGHHKHGKTELYRELLAHQDVCSQDRFHFSPGQRGMVMIAFNMDQDDLIYKIIRDRFGSPKQTSRQKVLDKYEYVFKHDRAGRLLDVQTFENLQIEQCCFTNALLDEISQKASRAVVFNRDHVVLRHVFVERLVTPLDVYLQQASPEDARDVVIDYGNAIKDLARINVFTGDMMTKNFGVTRLKRVVFYDYDELRPLLDCNFRRMPNSRTDEEELSEEPWFSVSPNDIFPEEFIYFLGLPPDLRELFLRHHKDLLTPEFWRRMQDRIRSGRLNPILPYTQAQRLRPGPTNTTQS